MKRSGTKKRRRISFTRPSNHSPTPPPMQSPKLHPLQPPTASLLVNNSMVISPGIQEPSPVDKPAAITLTNSDSVSVQVVSSSDADFPSSPIVQNNSSEVMDMEIDTPKAGNTGMSHIKQAQAKPTSKGPKPVLDADDKLPINRKRPPSPTGFNPPPAKQPNKEILGKPSLLDGLGKTGKSPSPSPLLTPLRQGGLSSASQVLNEEFKRKQTTENLKLKQLIHKEIRKHGKSKCIYNNIIVAEYHILQ